MHRKRKVTDLKNVQTSLQCGDLLSVYSALHQVLDSRVDHGPVTENFFRSAVTKGWQTWQL